MPLKKFTSAEEVIEATEAEGFKYIGTYSLPVSVSDQLLEDEREEQARKRNAMLMHVYVLGQCFVFEKPDVFSGPRTKKAYVRTAA